MRLKKAREATGLSQKKLGIAAGIDEFSASARMNQYETGKHIPNYSMLARIGMVLQIPTAYFYTEDNELAELILLYNSIHNTKRQKLVKELKRLIDL